MFPCEICEIFKDTFFNRTPPVAASIFYKMQFWEVFTSLKICLECTPPLTFPGTLKPTAYLKTDSTTGTLFQSLQIDFQWISKILWTVTMTKISFSVAQNNYNKFFFHVVIDLNDPLKTYNIIRTITLIILLFLLLQ